MNKNIVFISCCILFICSNFNSMFLKSNKVLDDPCNPDAKIYSQINFIKSQLAKEDSTQVIKTTPALTTGLLKKEGVIAEPEPVEVAENENEETPIVVPPVPTVAVPTILPAVVAPKAAEVKVIPGEVTAVIEAKAEVPQPKDTAVYKSKLADIQDKIELIVNKINCKDQEGQKTVEGLKQNQLNFMKSAIDAKENEIFGDAKNIPECRVKNSKLLQVENTQNLADLLKNLKVGAPVVSNSISVTKSDAKAVAENNANANSATAVNTTANADALGEKNSASAANIVATSDSKSNTLAANNSAATQITDSKSDSNVKSVALDNSLATANVLSNSKTDVTVGATNESVAVGVTTNKNDANSNAKALEGSFADAKTLSDTKALTNNIAVNNSTSVTTTETKNNGNSLADSTNESIAQTVAELKNNANTTSVAIDNSKSIGGTSSTANSDTNSTSTNGGNSISTGLAVSDINTAAVATNSSQANIINAGNSTSNSNSASVGTNAPYVSPTPIETVVIPTNTIVVTPPAETTVVTPADTTGVTLGGPLYVAGANLPARLRKDENATITNENEQIPADTIGSEAYPVEGTSEIPADVKPSNVTGEKHAEEAPKAEIPDINRTAFDCNMTQPITDEAFEKPEETKADFKGEEGFLENDFCQDEKDLKQIREKEVKEYERERQREKEQRQKLKEEDRIKRLEQKKLRARKPKFEQPERVHFLAAPKYETDEPIIKAQISDGHDKLVEEKDIEGEFENNRKECNFENDDRFAEKKFDEDTILDYDLKKGDDKVEKICIATCKKDNLGDYISSEFQDLLNNKILIRCSCTDKTTGWFMSGPLNDEEPLEREEKVEPVKIEEKIAKIVEEPKINAPLASPLKADAESDQELDIDEEQPTPMTIPSREAPKGCFPTDLGDHFNTYIESKFKNLHKRMNKMKKNNDAYIDDIHKKQLEKQKAKAAEKSSGGLEHGNVQVPKPDYKIGSAAEPKTLPDEKIEEVEDVEEPKVIVDTDKETPEDSYLKKQEDKQICKFNDELDGRFQEKKASEKNRFDNRFTNNARYNLRDQPEEKKADVKGSAENLISSEVSSINTDNQKTLENLQKMFTPNAVIEIK